MRSHAFVLSSLVLATALAGQAPVNDDCAAAIAVVFGVNGPYSNVNATTNPTDPVWPCATGGNDIWFSYVAPGSGTLIADTCSVAATYDSSLEIFDGTAGCGALVSLGCNDDACGSTTSQVTVAVTSGTTYFIRVGGWNASTGTFELNINGPAGTNTIATATNYGTGCVSRHTSFYEHFLTTPSIDLSNTAYSMLFTGTNYLVLPSTATFLAPSITAQNLNLGDDTGTSITLSTALSYPGGTTTSLFVASNGHISVASNGSAGDYTPTPAEMLNWANTSWAVWRDFICNASGNVMFEEVGGIAYITWNGVIGYVGTTPGTTPSTFQFQFNLSTGSIDVVFLGMDTVSVSGWGGGEGWVIGYSPGGPSLNPGSVDLTTAVPATIVLDNTDNDPLVLNSSARPIAGNTISLNTSNIGPTAPFGAILLSLTQFNPGLSLTGIGMPSCSQYQGGEVTLLYLPLGSPTASTPLVVPNAVGFHVFAQSFLYDPASGLTPLGAVASNGVDLGIGNL